jgi:hypothetical protein
LQWIKRYDVTCAFQHVAHAFALFSQGRIEPALVYCIILPTLNRDNRLSDSAALAVYSIYYVLLSLSLGLSVSLPLYLSLSVSLSVSLSLSLSLSLLSSSLSLYLSLSFLLSHTTQPLKTRPRHCLQKAALHAAEKASRKLTIKAALALACIYPFRHQSCRLGCS